MKKSLSLILVISMVMSMFTFTFATTSLKDVDNTDYEATVEALVELGIVNGYEDGTYRPEQNVSRAEMAKLLVVAMGLEPAAKLSEGVTKFSDVNGGWASGYVNIAAEYGYIIGYPDGTFRPDDTVSYAEAATMALRVLGYKSVIEARGTWPTNYIAKSEDLKILKDITYNSYEDGAKRGKVATLIWNMLKTEMWDIVGESEGSGLQYKADRIMLNAKFPDYSYSYAKFVEFAINNDGEVEVTLNDTYGNYKGDLESSIYTYSGVDFYTFVPGTEVEVLVNEEDEIVLTMVPTGKHKLVEGDKLTIDEDYDDLSGDSYDYAYGITERKEITEKRLLTAAKSQMIFEKTEKNGKYVKLNKEKYENKKYDYEVIIKDDKRARINDIDVGDIWTEVKVDNGEVFYMVVSSNSNIKGKLTKYVIKQHEGNKENYHLLTVDDKEYLMAATATYIENPKDEDEKQNKSFANSEELVDMKGEEVVLIRDFLGRVVRIEFDGSIDEQSKKIKFFVVSEEVEKEGLGKYAIGLETQEDNNTYKFAKTCNLAKTLYNEDKEIVGTLVAVEFNNDNEITNMELIARVGLSGDNFTELNETAGGNYITNKTEVVYDKEDVNGKYNISFIEKAEYDDKNEKINGVNVDESVIVISLIADEETYTAVFEKGLKAVENVKNEEMMIIVDAAETFKFAKFVVRFDDNLNREDNLVGLVEEARENRLGDYTITIDGKTYVFKAEDNITLVEDITELEGAAILFSVRKDKNEEEHATVVSHLFANVVVNGTNIVDRVEEVGSSAVAFKNAGIETFKETFHNTYDEYLFIRVIVDSFEGEIDGVEEKVIGKEIDALFFKEDDGIIYDENDCVIWVIEGLEWSEISSEK